MFGNRSGISRVITIPTYELSRFLANVSDYEHHATPLKHGRDYLELHKINRKGIAEEELDEHRESPLHKVMALAPAVLTVTPLQR